MPHYNHGCMSKGVWCVCTCAHGVCIHSSYMTLIGVHEMHGRVYPN